VTDDTVIWLTQDGFDKLKGELEHLRGPVRSEIISRISAARDEGDLKENGGYHAAREEQGKTEARIKQLEAMLEKAQIGVTASESGEITPGMVVTTRFVGDDEEEVFLLGAREMAGAHSDLEVYSPQSALGKAIIGFKKGDVVTYEAPNGKEIHVEILDAVPYSG
jgi:transcription elongation factor GreA